MPELPEVQTVVKGLQANIIGKKITSIIEIRSGTVSQKFDSKITGYGTIEKITRIGKYILIDTDVGLRLVVHLRMTGKLIFKQQDLHRPQHLRALIEFYDNSVLYFDDTRTFGSINIYRKTQKIPSIQMLGPDALSNDFSSDYLWQVLENRKAPIKNLLLDQSVVAGLGNIYVAEILFRAQVLPQKKARHLKQYEVKRIVAETKKILPEAIKHNGTTISDYKNVDGKSGEFQNFLRIYGKQKCQCGENITKIKQAGRSTFYCSKCQK
ncbi:MAG TPA: DNA-formamidopyrimidine glycosylase [Candidatus Cloacimonas sp.]|jgi:formamidopyrimidine-DNA glycosylase|nr:DNA-formamidopyrimidine glycosylase [Candidatus Cloacimonas sp.]